VNLQFDLKEKDMEIDKLKIAMLEMKREIGMKREKREISAPSVASCGPTDTHSSEVDLLNKVQELQSALSKVTYDSENQTKVCITYTYNRHIYSEYTH
jgi:hypothetical protein